MNSLLNENRPAVFCPGCAHDRVLPALDQALTGIGYAGKDVAVVTASTVFHWWTSGGSVPAGTPGATN